MGTLSVGDVVSLALPLLSTIFMVGFAALLLGLDFNRTTHRVFALFLIFRAATSALGLARGGLMAADTAQDISGYFLIPVVPLLLYLACVYPRRRWWIGTSRAGPWLVLAGVASLEALYFFDHGLLWTFGPSAELGSYSQMAKGLYYTGYGPLQLVTGLLFPSYGIVAFVLAREYLAAPRPTHSLLLVLAGFLLNGLFDGTGRLIELWSLIASGQAFPWQPWGWARAVLPALTLIPCAATLALFLAKSGRAAPDVAKRVRRLAWVCILPPASAIAVSLLAISPVGVASVPGQVISGVWRLALPGLVTYALLRYQLFDIDVKVKVAITDSTLVAAFLIIFFALDQTALYFISKDVGWPIALAESAFMAIMAGRLQKLAQRISARLMPQAKKLRDMTHTERVKAYRERYALALEDGTLSAKERAMLDALATRLGLERGERAAVPPASGLTPSPAA